MKVFSELQNELDQIDADIADADTEFQAAADRYFAAKKRAEELFRQRNVVVTQQRQHPCRPAEQIARKPNTARTNRLS